MDYEQIEPILQDKFDLARMYDYYFDENNYEWILGVETFHTLTHEIGIYCTFLTEDVDARLYGIPITIDRRNKWRISLVKEIKDEKENNMSQM